MVHNLFAVWAEFVAVVEERYVDSYWVAVAVAAVGNGREAMDADKMKRKFEGRRVMGDHCL